MKQITSKAFITKEKMINQDGEEEDINVVRKYVKDCNFYKVWINDLMSIIELFGGKKLTVIKHIMKNINTKTNTFTSTIAVMEKDLNKPELNKKDTASRKTIERTLKLLQECNFMKKIHSGHYKINPDILLQGRNSKHQKLLVEYHNINELKESKNNEQKKRNRKTQRNINNQFSKN